MSDFREGFFLSTYEGQSHQIAYRERGPEDGAPLVCVHGLTGNGHDFDYLAPVLVQDGYRVIAVDLPGRGRSDFLNDPLHYNSLCYLARLQGLLAHLKLTSVDWLGVSLGGLLGLTLAALDRSPVRRLILSDIGPEVPLEAMAFAYDIVKTPQYFEDEAALEKRLRETRGLTWGTITDAQWAHMAAHNARRLEDGRLTYAYDPDIARVFEAQPLAAVDLWAFWDKIACPVLVLHGARSIFLTQAVLEKMRGRGPDFALVTFDDCGHVPSLMAEEQIEAVRGWLGRQAAAANGPVSISSRTA